MSIEAESGGEGTGSRRRPCASILGWFAAVLMALVLLSMFFPTLGRRRQSQRGEECCRILENLYRAKEKLAEELDLIPGEEYPDSVRFLNLEDLIPYLPEGAEETSCPAGGVFHLRPLVDEFAEVVPPACDRAGNDPDGNGVANRGEGLHIHLRSHLQDPETGFFFREPVFRFPD